MKMKLLQCECCSFLAVIPEQDDEHGLLCPFCHRSHCAKSGFVRMTEDAFLSHAGLDSRAGPEREPRILDEGEVKSVAKKVGLPRYMWDTEEGRMDLARFAHEASRLATGSGS